MLRYRGSGLPHIHLGVGGGTIKPMTRLNMALLSCGLRGTRHRTLATTSLSLRSTSHPSLLCSAQPWPLESFRPSSAHASSVKPSLTAAVHRVMDLEGTSDRDFHFISGKAWSPKGTQLVHGHAAGPLSDKAVDPSQRAPGFCLVCEAMQS